MAEIIELLERNRKYLDNGQYNLSKAKSMKVRNEIKNVTLKTKIRVGLGGVGSAFCWFQYVVNLFCFEKGFL